MIFNFCFVWFLETLLKLHHCDSYKRGPIEEICFSNIKKWIGNKIKEMNGNQSTSEQRTMNVCSGDQERPASPEPREKTGGSESPVSPAQMKRDNFIIIPETLGSDSETQFSP